MAFGQGLWGLFILGEFEILSAISPLPSVTCQEMTLPPAPSFSCQVAFQSTGDLQSVSLASRILDQKPATNREWYSFNFCLVVGQEHDLEMSILLSFQYFTHLYSTQSSVFVCIFTYACKRQEVCVRIMCTTA